MKKEKSKTYIVKLNPTASEIQNPILATRNSWRYAPLFLGCASHSLKHIKSVTYSHTDISNYIVRYKYSIITLKINVNR